MHRRRPRPRQPLPPRRDVVPLPRRRASRATRRVAAGAAEIARARVLPPLVVLALAAAGLADRCAPSRAPRCRRRSRSGSEAQRPDHRSVLRRRPAGHRPRLARADLAAARRDRLRPRRRRRHRARRAHRPSRLGHARPRSDLPGAAHRAAARLAADLARRLPRQPALGDLRDLHHRDLADHHQHRGRHPQHPAGLPQRRRGAAAQPARVLLHDHDARRPRPTSSPACASASACPGSPSSRPRC